MIFPNLKVEPTLQVNDKTRLDATDSFVSTDEAAITLVEIQPEDAAGYIDVTTNKYLDWQYSSAGDKTVTVRITTDGSPTSSTATVSVVTSATDSLFSNDAMLVALEDNIMEYVRAGRNSFIDKHREAQTQILDYLDEKRIWDEDGDRLTKAAIVDTEEVRSWSKYLTLKIIFESLSNSIEDIFHQKSLRYGELMGEARNRAALRLDFDGDGTVDADERRDISTIKLARR